MIKRWSILILSLSFLLASCGEDFDCEELSLNIGSECSDDQGNVGQLGLSCECVTGILDITVDVDNSAVISLDITANSSLDFFITPAPEGFTAFVNPFSDVQIIADPMFGYPTAINMGSNISEISFWSVDSNNLVLGNSVEFGGNFNGAGEKYLGFRVLDNDDIYYGWMSLDVSADNSSISIDRFRINYNAGEFIRAGED
jgi:hypothetical protein